MMDQAAEVREYVNTAQAYLQELCALAPHRRTGSAGNRAATDYFARTAKDWGYEIDVATFACLDHRSGKVSLTSGKDSFPVEIGPYSPGCDISAQLVPVSTGEELEKISCPGKILLLRGEICSEPLMPKNFPFYNPDHHKKIYSLIEEKRPAAVVTAPPKNPEMVGAIYPFPLIEDGDFDLPSAYCAAATGDEIAAHSGEAFSLKIEARRIPSTASNVLLRKNPKAGRKVVVSAHIDTREGTVGASDDGSGTVVLLLLARLFRDYRGPLGIEIVAFNGEDNYSAAGEKDYLRRFGTGLKTALVAVNIDDVGYREGKTAFSFYECPEAIQKKVKAAFGSYGGLMEGPPWFQGDHMIFVQGGTPAIAFTAEKMVELMATVTHTARDTPDLIDPKKLVETALALRDLIEKLGE